MEILRICGKCGNMPDLVGTCPQDFWEQWIAEGDAASVTPGIVYPSITGEEWSWYTKDTRAESIKPGERFYVVCRGLLRGWAPVVRVGNRGQAGWEIIRRGGAVACTVPGVIPGFRGLRVRWWDRKLEVDFPDWKTADARPIGKR